MTIWNLTQHKASPAQRNAGVIDLEGDDLTDLKMALTFECIPRVREIETNAKWIVNIAKGAGAEPGDQAMIGGAPYLMSSLERALRLKDIEPVYAFSVRDVQENSETGEKTVRFKHLGFVRR